jgi:hypothetical protein
MTADVAGIAATIFAPQRPFDAGLTGQGDAFQGGTATQGQAARAAVAAREQGDTPKPVQASPQPTIAITYEQHIRVVKVHDRKAHLIYQVPPKGRVHLLLMEEKAGMLSTIA